MIVWLGIINPFQFSLARSVDNGDIKVGHAYLSILSCEIRTTEAKLEILKAILSILSCEISKTSGLNSSK